MYTVVLGYDFSAYSTARRRLSHRRHLNRERVPHDRVRAVSLGILLRACARDDFSPMLSRSTQTIVFSSFVDAIRTHTEHAHLYVHTRRRFSTRVPPIAERESVRVNDRAARARVTSRLVAFTLDWPRLCPPSQRSVYLQTLSGSQVAFRKGDPRVRTQSPSRRPPAVHSVHAIHSHTTFAAVLHIHTHGRV